MNIVFDIDDTIIDETGFMLKHTPGYLLWKYHIRAEIKNPNGYNLSQVFGLQDLFQSNIICKQIENKFWNNVFFCMFFQKAKTV